MAALSRVTIDGFLTGEGEGGGGYPRLIAQGNAPCSPRGSNPGPVEPQGYLVPCELEALGSQFRVLFYGNTFKKME